MADLNNTTNDNLMAIRQLQADLLNTKNNLNDFFIVISAVLVFGTSFHILRNGSNLTNLLNGMI